MSESRPADHAPGPFDGIGWPLPREAGWRGGLTWQGSCVAGPRDGGDDRIDPGEFHV